MDIGGDTCVFSTSFRRFPVFILAMVLVAIRGTGPVNVVFAVAFVNFPVFPPSGAI